MAVRNRGYVYWNARRAPVNMELPLENTSVFEQRSVIRFLCAKGLKASKIHLKLVLVYGHSSIDVSNVRRWCKAFKEGRSAIEDEERSG